MSILDFLKKIKLPSFEDDFIQDPAEKAMDEGPDAYIGREGHDPGIEVDAGTAQGDPWDEKCRVVERHHDPSDPTSLLYLDIWE